MAGIDATIPLSYRLPQIEGPADQYRTLLQLRGLMQQQELQRTQMEQDRQTREALAQSGGDVEKALQIALQSGNHRAAAALTPLYKAQQEAAQRKAIAGGDMNDPAHLRRIGLALNKPEFITHAERLEKVAEERKGLAALQGQSVPVQFGQAPSEQAAIEALRAGGGRPMTVGVGHTPQAGAEWSATSPQGGGGALASLMQSQIPAIANHARALQARINSGGMPLAMANQAVEQLHAREALFLQQQGMQTDRLAATEPYRAAQEELARERIRQTDERMEADRRKAAEASQKIADAKVQHLGTALERANLPEADAVLRGVEDALKKNPDLPKYLGGPGSVRPDWSLPQPIREGRQAFQKLFNITLKNRSGAAVTIPEFERLKNEFATGVWKHPDQVKAGVEQARTIISDHYRSVAAGFGPDALKGYNENLRATGGTPLLEHDAGSRQPQSAQQFPTATNPQTGEQLIYKDGKWQKP